MRGPRYRSAVVSSEWTGQTPTSHLFRGATCFYLEIGPYTAMGSTNISANSRKPGSLVLDRFYRLLHGLSRDNTLIFARSDDLPRMAGQSCRLTEAGAQLLTYRTKALVNNRKVSSARPNPP